MDDKKNYPDFKESLILLALLLILQIVVGSIYNLLISLDDFVPFSFKGKILEYFILYYLGPFLTIGLTINYALKKSRFLFSEIFGNIYIPGIIYFSTSFLIIGLSIILSEIDNFIITFLPEELLMDEIFFQLLDNNFFLVLITVGILAPVLEEILFRGIILKGFLKNYPLEKALTLSALLFALAHFNIRQGVITFLMGLFLGWLYYKTESLILPIYGHFLSNSLAVIGFHFVKIPGYTDYTSSTPQFQPLWLTVTGILLIIAGYFMFKKYLKNLN